MIQTESHMKGGDIYGHKLRGEVGGLTRAFALFALWTHTAVYGISGICHTLHTLRAGVVLTQVVQHRTSAT